MMNGKKTEVLGEQPAPLQLYPPLAQYALYWD
jgi:hypothetical protein